MRIFDYFSFHYVEITFPLLKTPFASKRTDHLPNVSNLLIRLELSCKIIYTTCTTRFADLAPFININAVAFLNMPAVQRTT